MATTAPAIFGAFEEDPLTSDVFGGSPPISSNWYVFLKSDSCDNIFRSKEFSCLVDMPLLGTVEVDAGLRTRIFKLIFLSVTVFDTIIMSSFLNSTSGAALFLAPAKIK